MSAINRNPLRYQLLSGEYVTPAREAGIDESGYDFIRVSPVGALPAVLDGNQVLAVVEYNGAVYQVINMRPPRLTTGFSAYNARLGLWVVFPKQEA